MEVPVLIDSIQNSLEEYYNLPRRIVIRDYLYPIASSSKAAYRVSEGGDKGFVVNDLDSGIGEPGRQRMLIATEFTPPFSLRRLGRPTFSALNPVIHISEEVGKSIINAKDLDNVIRKREPFRIVAEEVSHFQYSVQRYESLNTLPGQIMAEGMALVDIVSFYTKHFTRNGMTLTDKRNPGVRIIDQFIKSLPEKRRSWKGVKDGAERKFASLPWSAKNEHRADYNKVIATTDTYIGSVNIMEGLIDYSRESELKGHSIAIELGNFYTLSIGDQLKYLTDIYTTYKNGKYLSQFNSLLEYVSRRYGTEGQVN